MSPRPSSSFNRSLIARISSTSARSSALAWSSTSKACLCSAVISPSTYAVDRAAKSSSCSFMVASFPSHCRLFAAIGDFFLQCLERRVQDESHVGFGEIRNRSDLLVAQASSKLERHNFPVALGQRVEQLEQPPSRVGPFERAFRVRVRTLHVVVLPE